MLISEWLRAAGYPRVDVVRGLGECCRITMTGVDDGFARQDEKSIPDRIREGCKVAEGPTRGTRPTGEQGVSAEQRAQLR